MTGVALAAFIGAGGIADSIVSGLALNDPFIILQGVVLAALPAILMELMFDGVERAIMPLQPTPLGCRQR